MDYAYDRPALLPALSKVIRTRQLRETEHRESLSWIQAKILTPFWKEPWPPGCSNVQERS
jgi:hypothetical protein